MSLQTPDYTYIGHPAANGSIRYFADGFGRVIYERREEDIWVEIAIIGNVSGGAYADYVLSVIPTIEAYWLLAEASGLVAADYSGNANVGEYFGTPGYQAVAGPPVTTDQAVQFEAGDRVEADFTPTSVDEATFIWWYKPSDAGFWDGTAWKCFLSVHGASGQYGVYKKNAANELYLFSNSGGDATISVPAGANDWSMFAARYSVSQGLFNLWINGSTRGAIVGTPTTIGVISAGFPRFANNDQLNQPCDGYYSTSIYVPSVLDDSVLSSIYSPA
jgi:hypothetical protein